MKIILFIAGLLFLLMKAEAGPDRYGLRIFPSKTVNLQPLFAWWKTVSGTANVPIDLTDIDTNKLDLISNLWLELPPRPLPDWVNISAGEGDIVVAGALWKVNAVIMPAPNMTKRETIYLRHPPVKEIQDYKTARANYASLMDAQAKDMATEQFWESNIQAEAEAIQPTNDPATSTISPTTIAQMRILQRDSIAAISNINYLHAQTQSRDAAVASANTYLSVFPDKNVYRLDHFALHTDVRIDGIEVYDLGTAPGLTY